MRLLRLPWPIDAITLTILVTSQPVRKRALSNSWERPSPIEPLERSRRLAPRLSNEKISVGYAKIPLGPEVAYGADRSGLDGTPRCLVGRRTAPVEACRRNGGRGLG
jgi:hypothetical protein